MAKKTSTTTAKTKATQKKVEPVVKEKIKSVEEKTSSEKVEETVNETFDKMEEIVESNLTETEKIEQVEQAKSPETEETITHIVSDIDIENNPELTENGINEGDKIELGKTEETEETEETKSPESEDIELPLKLKKLLALENNFSHVAVGRHLTGIVSKAKLKSFYKEFTSLGLMANQTHFGIVKEIKKILNL